MGPRKASLNNQWGFLFCGMPCCYIIHSEKLNRFYVGACHDNLDERVEKHNNHFYGKHHFTAIASDWKLFLEIEVADYAHAVRLERKVKGMKSSVYIRNLKKYPELIVKILNETTSN